METVGEGNAGSSAFEWLFWVHQVFFGQDKKSQRQVTVVFQVRVAAEEAAADATGVATCGDQGWRP